MSVMISMILLRGSIALPISAIEREFQNRFPELGVSGTANEGITATLRLKDGEVVLGNMPAPIPWSDLEDPCSTSMLWKNASDEVKKHETHLIVTLLSELNKGEQAWKLWRGTPNSRSSRVEATMPNTWTRSKCRREFTRKIVNTPTMRE
jgi:hypothetical protein